MFMRLGWVENGCEFRFWDLTGLDGHLQPTTNHFHFVPLRLTYGAVPPQVKLPRKIDDKNFNFRKKLFNIKNFFY